MPLEQSLTVSYKHAGKVGLSGGVGDKLSSLAPATNVSTKLPDPQTLADAAETSWTRLSTL